MAEQQQVKGLKALALDKKIKDLQKNFKRLERDIELIKKSLGGK